MRRLVGLTITMFTLLLSGCGSDEVVNNFETRRSGTYISDDGKVLIEYTTDTDGRLTELDIDHLLTIEEMIYLNPSIDFNYELEGFDGDIFTKPSGQCTSISNDLWIPINLEIGNTRYKYDDTECSYKTVDTTNNFRAGFADDYELQDTLLESRNTTISIIVYRPDELVKFVEIYQIPHTYELFGVYHLLINSTRQGLAVPLVNYYNDTGIYEQLYLKHQANTPTISEVNGLSEELNLLDLGNATEASPLIEHFEVLYAEEIQAMEELQQDIGINFAIEEEPTEEEPTE